MSDPFEVARQRHKTLQVAVEKLVVLHKCKTIQELAEKLGLRGTFEVDFGYNHILEIAPKKGFTLKA